MRIKYFILTILLSGNITFSKAQQKVSEVESHSVDSAESIISDVEKIDRIFGGKTDRKEIHENRKRERDATRKKRRRPRKSRSNRRR